MPFNALTTETIKETVDMTLSDYLSKQQPFKGVLKKSTDVNATQAELLGKILADFDVDEIASLLEALEEVMPKPSFEVLTQQLEAPNQQISYQTLSYAGFGNEIFNTQEIVSERLLSDFRFLQEQVRGIYQDQKGKRHLNSITFARFIKAKYPLVTTSEGKFYFLEDSMYIPKTRLQVSTLVGEEVKSYIPNSWNQTKQNDYLEAIRQETLIDESQKEQEQQKYMNFPNGYIDLATLQFHTEGQEELFFTIQQSYEYDAAAECPLFLETIDSIFNGDEQLITVFQQVFGYLLTHEQKIQKGFFFLGSGSNGKSLLIKLMTAVIGQEFITNTSLKKLSSRFGYSDLIDKKVMFSTENEMSSYNDTEHFKALTGGDRITVERKNRDPVTMQLTTKVVVALNQMMDTQDISEGFFRRIFIFPFTQHYLPPVPLEQQEPTKKYMDMGLEDKLMRELPGVLNFALEGLRELRENGYILPKCDACEHAIEQYRLQQTPMEVFFDCNFEESPSEKFLRPELKEVYKNWREQTEPIPRPYSDSDLQKDFERYLDSRNLLSEAKKIRGHYYYKGIRLKSSETDQ